jgi:hypothetical protein
MTSGVSATSSAAYLRVLPASVPQRVSMRALRPSVYERRVAGLSFRIVRGRVHEHAEATHALALLRPRRERPRDRPTTE